MAPKRLLKSTIIILLASLWLMSCGTMFSDWIGSGGGTRDVKWQRLDIYEPGGTLNINQGLESQSPKLCVNNGSLYAVWIEGNMYIYMKRFNGDYNNPYWEDMTDYGNSGMISNPSEVAVISYNGEIYFAYIGNGSSSIYVVRYNKDGIWEQVGENFHDSSPLSNVNLAVWENDLYISWQEGSTIRMKKYDGGGGWLTADNSSPLGIDETGFAVHSPTLFPTDYGIYIAFLEFNGSEDRVKVRRYDHNGWHEVTDNLNYNPGSGGNAYNPSIVNYGSEVYTAWSEWNPNSGIYGVHVSDIYNYIISESSVQGIRYSYDGNPVTEPQISVVNNRLYAMWLEQYNSYNQLRARVYRGYDEEWEFIDGGESYGLNISQDQDIEKFHTLSYDSKIFVIFTEHDSNNTYQYQTHVKVGR
ncbi:hypothetical protein ACFL20_00710 [Spirochaetota bacterium]